jgi:hypothetical protein
MSLSRGCTRPGIGLGVLIAAALSIAVASPATAGYQANGYDLGLTKSDSVVNGTAAYQTVPLFNATNGASAVGGTINTTFTSASYQNVVYARLYLDVFGGTPFSSAQWTATLNGNALGTLTIGTTANANPANRDAGTTCVYGSGYGYWEIAYADIASKLKHDGTANTFSFSAIDDNVPTKAFDGRQYGATLVVVYSDPSLQQTLDYQLFEGDGYMRKTAGSTAPAQVINLDRDFTINGVNTANVASAIFTAGYSTGDSGQTDQIYFNGTALGPTAGLGNDIARGYSGNYDSELHSFDVTNYLQGTNSVLYSIDQSVLGGTGESTLHADWAMLTVVHPTPEPATLGFLAAGAVGLWLRKRGRR